MDEYRCPNHGIVAISIDETVPFKCRKCGGHIEVAWSCGRRQAGWAHRRSMIPGSGRMARTKSNGGA
jgi:hypothetical protein